MITIYHNPRCAKSREGLALIESSGKPFKIIKYLEKPLTRVELFKIIQMLEIAPIQLVRKGEKIWKETYRKKDLSDDEILTAMIENPKLIERPIVISEKKAVIGRPKENIESLLALN